MRIAVLLLLGLVASGGCTKANPNQCCTDAADCNAKGIPVDMTCGDGLVCRGNQCIAEVCNGPADCDLSAPFCVDTSCSAMCTADDQCPGNGGSADAVHCVSGACVACRDSSDCSTSNPVCDMGACRGCVMDSECASGACDVDSSTCVEESTIAYASPTGAASSSCSKSDPCSLTHAFSITDASRPNIKLLPGTYTSNDTYSGTYKLSLYGPATMNAVEYNGNTGTLRVRDLTVTGYIDCQGSGLPHPSMDIRRVVITPDVSNAPAIGASICDVVGSEISVTAGATIGAAMTFDEGGGPSTSSITFDRISIDGADPAFFISGPTNFTITNSIFTHQGTLDGAFQLGVSGAGGETGRVSFSTFYDSTVTCPASPTFIAFDDNIFFNDRNGAPQNTVSGAGCTHRFDLIKPQTTSVGTSNLLGMDPRFVNTATGDLHLMTGSPAIDAADPAATLTSDYDGTARPQGARRDIGAFEYKP